ncbi:MAG: sigma 54-interacting transcriptional regulator [Candidatus Eisenbacteria bacterium]|nr:sigma 54-interacting transcriptional regulator [Candidatus Eisenbacteria bacterium]
MFEKFGSSQANSARIALGNCYILSGQHRLAKKTLDQCLSVCESRGFARTEAIAHEYLGDLLFEQGKTRQALQQYNKALEIGMRIAPRGDVVVEAERRRAEALAMLSRYDEAEQALDHGEEVASAIPEPYEAAVMSRIRMLVAAGRGKREEIQQAYRVAREKIWAMDEMVQRGRLLESWAFVLAAWDEPAQRREVLYEARNFYSAAGAKGCFDRVTRKLEWERHAEDESSSKPRFRYGMVVAHVSTSRHLDLLERYKDTYMPVLILGETGTGKELFARAVHELRGNNGAWVAVNCGAMPRELVEAELFGVVRGAYTGAVVDRPGVFERAHNGTLFLDEVGELPPGAQTRLLRALECGEVCRVGDTLTRKVKFRLVAATHRDLRLGVLEGWFRGDLYYRLEGVVLKVLPLRERREEIEHIARHFLVELEHQMGRSVTVDDRFWESLRAREWPGNVRQLRRAMERAVFGLDVGEVLRSEHLDESTDNPVLSFQEAQDLEREKVMRALTRTNWNKTAASAIVGLKRTTLLALMKRLGIPAKKPA